MPYALALGRSLDARPLLVLALSLTFAVGPLASPAEGQGLASCPKWSQTSDPELWIPDSVALADYGSIAIVARSLTNKAVSVHSAGSPADVFQLFSDVGDDTEVAGAAFAPVGARCFNRRDSTGQNYRTHLEVFDTSADGAISWSHTFPMVHGLTFVPNPFVAISRDGSRVVAGSGDTASNEVILSVFDGAGNSITTQVIPGAWVTQAFDISADGGRVVVQSNRISVYNVDTQRLELDLKELNVSYGEAVSISGDGMRLALGGVEFRNGVRFGRLALYECDASGTWTEFHREEFGRWTEVRHVDLDFSGERVAFVLQDLFFEGFTVFLEDSGEEVPHFKHVVTNPENFLQLVASGIHVDDRGRTVGVTSWGDSDKLTPEVFVLDENGIRVCSFNSRGSALALDMTPAGDRFVAGATARHVNSFTNRGDIYFGSVGPVQLDFTGLPRVGEQIRLAVDSSVMGPEWFVQLSGGRIPFEEDALLALDPTLLIGKPLPTSSLAGRTWNIPFGMLGMEFHLQAFEVVPAHPRVSNVVSLRILP